MFSEIISVIGVRLGLRSDNLTALLTHSGSVMCTVNGLDARRRILHSNGEYFEKEY